MNIAETVLEAWSWIGLQSPISVLHRNAFGNLIFKDPSNQYWRLCPEELSCEIIAKSTSKAKSVFLTQISYSIGT